MIMLKKSQIVDSKHHLKSTPGTYDKSQPVWCVFYGQPTNLKFIFTIFWHNEIHLQIHQFHFKNILQEA